MNRKQQQILQVPMYAGMSDKYSPVSQPLEYAEEILNSRLDYVNVWGQRQGLQSYIDNVTNNQIYGIHEYVKTDGTRQLMMTSNNNLYRDSSGTSVFVGSGLTTNKPTYWVNWLNYGYLCDGTTRIQEYDGSAMGNWGATSVVAKHIELYVDWMFAIDAASPLLVKFSELRDRVTAWPAVNQFPFDSPAGDVCVGLVAVGDRVRGRLLVMKELSTWFLEWNGQNIGPTSFIKGLQWSDNGCVSAATIQKIRTGIMWADLRGIWWWRPGMDEPQKMTDEIGRFWTNNLAEDLSKSHAIYDHQHQLYKLFVPGINQTETTRCINLDVATGAITLDEFEGPVPTSGYVKRAPDEKQTIYIGTNDGNLTKLTYEAKADLTTAIKGKYVIPRLLGDIDGDKHVTQIVFKFQEKGDYDMNVKIEWSDKDGFDPSKNSKEFSFNMATPNTMIFHDYTNNPTLPGAAYFGNPPATPFYFRKAGTRRVSEELDIVGRDFTITLEQEGLNETFEILEVQLIYYATQRWNDQAGR